MQRADSRAYFMGWRYLITRALSAFFAEMSNRKRYVVFEKGYGFSWKCISGRIRYTIAKRVRLWWLFNLYWEGSLVEAKIRSSLSNENYPHEYVEYINMKSTLLYGDDIKKRFCTDSFRFICIKFQIFLIYSNLYMEIF